MENRSKHRYYLLYTTQDLFDTWCLVTSFGSTVTHHGRTIVQVQANKEAALLALFDIETKKRQRGYTYSDLNHPDLFHLRPQTIKEVLANKRLTKLNTAVVTLYHGVPDENSTPHPDQQELFILGSKNEQTTP
jgi:predicted DNA-binding WGR domain protein